MTNPASSIKDEVRILIDSQIETFRQPAVLTPSQRGDFITALGRSLRCAKNWIVLAQRLFIENRSRVAA